MLSDKYFYLVFTAAFFVIWLAIYAYRKDIRREMLLVSVLFGIGGVLSEFVHVQDWWRPLTITGTLLGLEDFFIGMFIGGIAAVIYEEVYKKKIKRKPGKHPLFGLKILIFFIIGMALFYGGFYILNLHSFYSIILTATLLAGYMVLKRKDLLKDAIFTGILMVVIGTIVYLILFLIAPGYFQKFWYLEDVWFAKLLFGIPIAEYVWFFFAGAFIGPIYEFWQEGRLVNK